MAKKKKQCQQTFLSPEKYIKQNARKLKIKACHITDNYEEKGIGYIIVAREHTGGRVTVGIYLTDKFCLGVMDTFYNFRMEDQEYSELLDRFGRIGIKEISYNEAHNRIFGAVEFAEEAGIAPHRNFAITQYILEEDNDKIPLTEYEYGKDGMHFLMVDNHQEASKYIPLLQKNLGEKFDYAIAEDLDKYDLTDDEEEDEFDEYNDIENHPMFKSYGPSTVYTYKHPEYPKEITLDNPIVEKILCDTANSICLKRKDTEMLLAQPHDSLRRDLEQLILYNIGIGCDGIPDDVIAKEFNGVIGNAVMLLAEVGNADSSLDAVFEVLRQSEDFIDYHIGDGGTETFVPTLYKLGRNRTDKLMAFMKEEGLYTFAKCYVPEAAAFIVHEHPERREEIIEWFRELLLFATEKLPETQFVDNTLAASIICALADIKAIELQPEIKALFDTGLVDLGYCGTYQDVIKDMTGSGNSHLYEHLTDIYKRFEDMKKRFG